MRKVPLLYGVLAIVALLIIGCKQNKDVKKYPRSVTLSKKSPYVAYLPKVADNQLMQSIRYALVEQVPFELPENRNFSFEFNPDYSWVFITLYQEGQAPLRFGSKRNTLRSTINRVIVKIRQNRRYKDFKVSNPSEVRIGFEIITTPLKQIDIIQLTGNYLSGNRFEVGVNGLKIETDGKAGFFMPTDAYVRNKLDKIGIIKFLKKRYRMEDKDCTFYSFCSRSLVTFKDSVLALYRGYPVKNHYTLYDLKAAFLNGLDWLVKHQDDSGKFIYFVDSITGRTKDYLYDRSKLLAKLHAKKYYNIVRHNGALICLLKGYNITGNKKYIFAVKKGIEYLKNHIKWRENNRGEKLAYVFYNQKAKLGSSGLAVAILSMYQQVTEDKCYYNLTKALALHLLDQIKKDGEFNYYYIHPLTNKRPDEYFFSFYYPGEALLGLAKFYQICDDSIFRKRIINNSERALNFLMFIRPIKYTKFYKSLPSDSWLMSATLELTKVPQLDRNVYKEFVYNDATAMMEHQYTSRNALYPDYEGGFFYQYGDHVYPDGARAEGLLAAYKLAERENKTELSGKLLKRLKSAALCQLHLVNTPESIYASFNPSIALGGIRFKLTRQWFRIDTIGHVASFYMQLVDILHKESAN